MPIPGLAFRKWNCEGFWKQAGFERVQSWIVDREKQTPAFETILAVGTR